MDLEAAKSSELEELDSDAFVIPSRELVVGDLVLLESGNVIPADVRLLHCTDCRVDEAMLTGESMDVQKNHLWRPTADGKEQLSPPNMLFSGTNMVTGRAVGIVVATGMHTRIGRIASLLIEKTDEEEEAEEEAAAEQQEEAAAIDSKSGKSPVPALQRQVSARHVQTESERRHERRERLRDELQFGADFEQDLPNMHPHALFGSDVHMEDSETGGHGLGLGHAHQRRGGSVELAVIPEERPMVPGAAPAAVTAPTPALTRRQSSTASVHKKKQLSKKLSKAPSVASENSEADSKSAAKARKKSGNTNLQNTLRSVGLTMSGIGLTCCILVFVIGMGRGFEDPAHPDQPRWLSLLLISVSLAVSAIPEGLPLAVTICLAMGSMRLARAKTLVRKLPAVENLGMVTVVCSVS